LDMHSNPQKNKNGGVPGEERLNYKSWRYE